MNNANKEVDILTDATLLAGTVYRLENDEVRKKYLSLLRDAEAQAMETTLDAHKTLKRLVLLTVRSAIRLAEHGKQSDAKLTYKNGKAVGQELARLARLAKRRGRD